jgi:hypothetical protein
MYIYEISLTNPDNNIPRTDIAEPSITTKRHENLLHSALARGPVNENEINKYRNVTTGH